MAKSFSGYNYEQNKGDFEFKIHTLLAENLKLSSENLQLSTKQLKRYFLYSIASFFVGIISAIIVAVCISKLIPGDKSKLEQRIITLEQTVSQLADSIQTLKVSYTKQKDSVIEKIYP